ncbi:MAG: DUF1178 family protein [Rubellimicrobium sp.]|nr:DUF1178 family protein [Rubellimicrobium sp.]
MILYSLTCEHAHRFESWFQSSAAFERLQAAGMVACAVCGSAKVEKALMAPAVASAAAPSLGKAETPLEQALAEIRRHVEEDSDYVGLSFATEARAMHEGRSPARSIWGEAKPEDARALVEDGVPVAPLPFRPRSRQN